MSRSIVDHRFYRSKYDVAKIMAAFSATLRTDVDLATVSELVVAVVAETMQPTNISLWLLSMDHDGNESVPWEATPLASAEGN